MNKASSDFRNNDMVLYLNVGILSQKRVAIVDDFYDSLESLQSLIIRLLPIDLEILQMTCYYMPSKKVKKTKAVL